MLLWHTFGKVDLRLGVNHTQVLLASAPLFRNINYGQVQHFQQVVVGGKDRFSLRHFAQLAVKALNGIGGIDQSPDFLRVLGVGTEIGTARAVFRIFCKQSKLRQANDFRSQRSPPAVTADAATASVAWPWQVVEEMLKWRSDGDTEAASDSNRRW